MSKRIQEDRIIRKLKKKSPWTSHLTENVRVALDLNVTEELKTVAPKGSICTTCKGVKMLCRKARCPIITRIYTYLRNKAQVETIQIDGSSPPGVFIGRIGYPFIYAGPLVPPFYGNTSHFDRPEEWFGKTIDEIVDFRFKLVRGKHRVNVNEPEKAGRILEDTQFLAMADRTVDVELSLKKKPNHHFVFKDNIQPIGPSAPIKDIKIGNFKLEPKIEKAYYDSDLKASEAVLELYNSGVLVSQLQKALSVGAFGIKGRRRLVPTRWSITATDSMISQNLMEKIKTFPLINKFRIYESNYLDNRFEVLMIPDSWKYEAMEAWYPGTIWNSNSNKISLIGDWESFKGRTRYAGMGGCYYAARLAVNEKLIKERRQATVIVLREAHKGYIMPVGVWQVRENVRNALRNDPLKYDKMEDVLKHLSTKFEIPLKSWIENTKILKDTLVQTKLTNYFKS
jgi:hypothetical protein